ncbi:MAG: lysophospholipid acyltransferase family protein [Polyangiaceae bacterium]|jgi:Kdo2-lipid IVA lauroyltransferase/acyltransferase
MTPAAVTGFRDLREGGAWTRTQRLKNGVIVVVVRAALALLVPLPARVLRVLGRGVGLIAYAFGRRARGAARRSVARVFPEMSTRRAGAIVFRSYAALGGYLGDAVASLDPRRPLEPLAVDDAALALFAKARSGSVGRPGHEREPRGVLFASAHLGPWERVAATLVARGVPMTVLARETYDPRLASVYDRLRAARSVRAIYRGLPGASTRIVRTLREGGVLGVPMDLRSRVPSVEVTFLGQRASVPVGPARIALRMGAAVIVGTVALDPSVAGGLRITCTEIPTADLVPGPAGEKELTARLAAELSARIRALPTEWVWMHDRFGGDLEGSSRAQRAQHQLD